jgi:hypothetical protein
LAIQDSTPRPKYRTSEVHRKRVTGIGGIFFKAKDAPAMQAWYKRHLAIDVQEWGGTAFTWADSDGKPTGGTTVWSVGPEEGNQFNTPTLPAQVDPMRRTRTIIGVGDVPSSFKWYQSLFGLLIPATATGRTVPR